MIFREFGGFTNLGAHWVVALVENGTERWWIEAATPTDGNFHGVSAVYPSKEALRENMADALVNAYKRPGI